MNMYPIEIIVEINGTLQIASNTFLSTIRLDSYLYVIIFIHMW